MILRDKEERAMFAGAYVDKARRTLSDGELTMHQRVDETIEALTRAREIMATTVLEDDGQ